MGKRKPRNQKRKPLNLQVNITCNNNESGNKSIQKEKPTNNKSTSNNNLKNCGNNDKTDTRYAGNFNTFEEQRVPNQVQVKEKVQSTEKRENRKEELFYIKDNYENDPYFSNNINTIRPISSIVNERSKNNKYCCKPTATSRPPQPFSQHPASSFYNQPTGVRPKIYQNEYSKQDLNNEFYSRCSLEDKNMFESKINQNVKKCETKLDNFCRIYQNWKKERKNSILKLQMLVKEVHGDQLMYNQANMLFKEINVGSRQLKDINHSPSVDFFSSLANFVTDAACGITCAAQAFNADGYSTKFKEIMDNDAELTRPLHDAKSQFLKGYHEVEEVIRDYHSKTFGETVRNISKTLRVEDLWLDVKNSKGESNSTIQNIDIFLNRNLNMQVMENVCDSFQEYFDDNPAALEACKSAGRAFHGIYDTWGRDTKNGRSCASGNVSIIANRLLLTQVQSELGQLRLVASNTNGAQAKLEIDISNAISSLEYEMREISNIFEKREGFQFYD